MESEPQLPDYLQGATCVFSGARFKVFSKQLPGRDNVLVQRDIVVHPGAVVIIPMLSPKTILLVTNYRLAVGKTLLELPAGTLEPGEAPIETAKRELEEETGFRTKNIKPLFDFYTSPGICTEKMYAFSADELEFVGQRLDPGEEIEVVKVSWDQAHAMIRNGEIIDGKTIAALLYYTLF